uniref:Pentatricopeptide repeat-containing protein n=1 Tax=Acrobeloides nanus TaxID=290746 RepID=A0A914D0R5_9BILA
MLRQVNRLNVARFTCFINLPATRCVSTSVGNFATNRRHMSKALKMKKRKPANKTNVKKINVFSRVKNLLTYFEENLGEFNSEELNKLSIRDIIERMEYGSINRNTIDSKKLLEFMLMRLNQKSFDPTKFSESELVHLVMLGNITMQTSLKEKHQLLRTYLDSLWSIFKARGVYISTNLWNAKYQVEFANQKKVDAMELLEKLNKHGLEPNAKTFEVCTSIFAAEGKFAEITTIIDYMKDLKMTVTLKILENFVYASALVGGIEAGTKALAQLLNSYSISNEKNRALLLSICSASIKAGNFKDLAEFMTKHNLSSPELSMPWTKFVGSTLEEANLIDETSLEKFLESESINFVLKYFDSDEYRNKLSDRPHLKKFYELLSTCMKPEIVDQPIHVKTFVKQLLDTYSLSENDRELLLSICIAYIKAGEFKDLTEFDLTEFVDRNYLANSGLSMPLTKFIGIILDEAKLKDETSLEKFLNSESKKLYLRYFESDEYHKMVGDRPHLKKFHEFLLNSMKPEIGDQPILVKAYVNQLLDTYSLTSEKDRALLLSICIAYIKAGDFKNLLEFVARNNLNTSELGMPLAKFIDCILIETKSKGENSLEKFLKSEYKNLVLEYFKSDEYRRKVGDRPHLNKFHEFLLNPTEPEISDQSITPKAYTSDEEGRKRHAIDTHTSQSRRIQILEKVTKIIPIKTVDMSPSIPVEDIRKGNLSNEYVRLRQPRTQILLRETTIVPKPSVIRTRSVPTARGETENIRKGAVSDVLKTRARSLSVARAKTRAVALKPAIQPSTPEDILRLRQVLGNSSVVGPIKRLSEEGNLDEAFRIYKKTYEDTKSEKKMYLPPSFDLMKAAIVSKNKGILKELREITKDGLGESGDNSFLIDMAVSFFELNNDDMAIKILQGKDVFLSTNKFKFVVSRELRADKLDGETRKDVIEKLIKYADCNSKPELQEIARTMEIEIELKRAKYAKKIGARRAERLRNPEEIQRKAMIRDQQRLISVGI